MKSIGEAINQKKFKSEYQKAVINLAYTASRFNQGANAVLKPYGLTLPQFNILRILRGMAPQPGSIKDLTQRMVDKSSNASRLVDKLVDKSWVKRVHCPEDRRQVNISITKNGLDHLEKASLAMEENNNLIFSKISKAEAEQLNYLLDKIRN